MSQLARRKPGERTSAGGFDTLEAAIYAAEKIVEVSLDDLYRPGATAAQLYSDYRDFGDDPFIRGSSWSAWDYANERSTEMCSTASPPIAPGKSRAAPATRRAPAPSSVMTATGHDRREGLC
jgi:hypothetical protein